MFNRPALLPYIWMLSSCVAFAFMGMSAKALGHDYHCDWRLIALSRSGLATLFALALCWQGRVRLVLFRPGILWIRSFAGSLSLGCTFFILAQSQLRVSEILVLTNLFPIWVAILSWPLTGEFPENSIWLSVLIGGLGVVLIAVAHPQSGDTRLAIGLALVASLCSAVAMLGLHRLHDIDARAIVVHFSAVSTLFIVTAIVIRHDFPLEQLTSQRVVPWLLLAVGSTATVGQLFLTRAFAAGSPSKVSVVALSQVVMVMGMEQCVEPQALNLVTILGMVLIMAPTAWVLWRNRRTMA